MCIYVYVNICLLPTELHYATDIDNDNKTRSITEKNSITIMIDIDNNQKQT